MTEIDVCLFVERKFSVNDDISLHAAKASLCSIGDSTACRTTVMFLHYSQCLVL